MISQLIINGIIAGSIYALIAIGFTIIYRTVRFFHLAHGIVYTAGAYFAYTFFRQLHINFIISFFLSITLSAILGIAIDRFAYYPLRQQKASDLIFLLSSFGIFIFLQNLIQIIYGAQILTLRTGPIKKGHSLSVFGYQLGAVITNNQIVILVISLLLSVILFWFIKYTKLGKAMRAVSDNIIGAMVVGIIPERTIILSFLIGSALAGAAGILISLETNIEPTMGFNAILKGMIASIVGGIGSIPGAMYGGFFLGIVENLGIWKFQAEWKDTIAFLILILFLLFRPGGIMGIKTESENL